MKAMLLAAGEGRRMRPLTMETPKPLLQVAGRPLIDYHLERLAEAGVLDVVINISWLAHKLEAHYTGKQPYGLNIHWSHEPTCLETGGGILQALPLLGTAPFMVVNADIHTDFPFRSLIDLQMQHAHLVLVPNPTHNPDGDFSIDSASNQIIDGGYPRFTFAGISVLHPELFSGQSAGHFPLAPLLRSAIQAGKVTGEVYRGAWNDVGTPQRLAALNGN